MKEDLGRLKIIAQSEIIEDFLKWGDKKGINKSDYRICDIVDYLEELYPSATIDFTHGLPEVYFHIKYLNLYQ